MIRRLITATSLCLGLAVLSAARSPAAEPATAQLILALDFDGSLAAGAADQPAVVSHGTVRYAPGRRGQCLVLDGQSWIDTGLLQAELGEAFTIECWVKPDRQQSAHADICGNHASKVCGVVLQQDDMRTNQYYAAYGAADGRWVLTEPVDLRADRWQHVALVKIATGIELFANNVRVAVQESTARAVPSPRPLAIGLGYTDPQRCFRGALDDVRIWRGALTDFAHAGIDPALTRETRGQLLDDQPRPAAAPPVQQFTLATEDTKLVLGITADSELVLSELVCPAQGWNWIARPVAFPLPRQVEVEGARVDLAWHFADADVQEQDGVAVRLRFLCEQPPLTLESAWWAASGPGPVRHTLSITNRSPTSVRVLEQLTFDLDVTGADTWWSFHSDGMTPDAVGVYRQPLSDLPAGRAFTVQTAPTGAFIPYVVLDADGAHGMYVGLEWSVCRIRLVTLDAASTGAVRVGAGNVADLYEHLSPGETLALRPGFLGTYRGDLDDAANHLRRWLLQHCVPAVVRDDPSYPKVQWNAFGATGKAPGSWDPVEAKFYPLIDDIAPLGFEEVMIDVAWWEGGEPDPDPIDWAAGMKQAGDYARAHGLRFGLYWTDDQDMATPAGRQRRADRIRRLFAEHGVDLWRSDCTRGEVIGPSFAATRGFYAMVDDLARTVPGFQWENCSGGGRIKDYGAMRRAVKIFNSDTYSALHVRQAFYDSSYAFHPAQLEGHLGSVDGRYRPAGVVGLKYAFRSMSMGAPEWFLDAPNGGNGTQPWTAAEREAVRHCVETYKARIRPLVRTGNLYHILPRPDGQRWDGMQYHDPQSGRGAVFLFKPAGEPETQLIRLKGLDPQRTYRLEFDDGTHPAHQALGAELMAAGFAVTLPDGEVSELVLVEAVP